MGNKIIKSVFSSLSDDEKEKAVDGLNIYRDGGNKSISLWDKDALMNQTKSNSFKQWIDENFSDDNIVMIVNDHESGTSDQVVMRCDKELKNCTIMEQQQDVF